jgi:hypothetical protein
MDKSVSNRENRWCRGSEQSGSLAHSLKGLKERKLESKEEGARKPAETRQVSGMMGSREGILGKALT